MVISKAFQDPSQNVDLLSTVSPWTEFSLVVPQNVIYLISDPIQKYFVVYLSCYWQQRNSPTVGHRLMSPFLGRGTMTLVIHWSGGVRFEYTSAQKQWITSAIASPPPWRASAVIAQSIPATLLVFIWRMASNVSSGVGGCIWIGKSWAAGCGRLGGVWPLSLLRRKLKYIYHSTRKSLSLLGGAPSLILALTLGFWSFPERSWIIFQVVV